ncbi:LIRP-like isoform X2 [Eriocheir sinensis]|uniref:LIRP-like isoform X2 n=1 Tax=Eriocheir sinensis TaxID=95602 RepID=UPI0021C60B4B|nr:LIRP-like isoform X2 [Eriocheir sinensis]
MKVLLLVAAAAAAQPSKSRGPLKTLPGAGAVREAERRLCGWKLANELNRVCKGVYNKPTVSTNALFYRRERGEGSVDFEDPVDVWPLMMELDFSPWTPAPPDVVRRGVLPGPPVVAASENQRLPFLSGPQASQVVGRSRRVKRGLSAECCRKACTVSELAGYCY